MLSLTANEGCFRRTGMEPTISKSSPFDIPNIIYIIFKLSLVQQQLVGSKSNSIKIFFVFAPKSSSTSAKLIIISTMIIDQVVWNVIKNKHCSFRMKTESQNFCKNEYSLTGLCNRRSCPLANSQYATIKQQKGVCYLYMKTAERSHLPSELWEKVKLNKSYQKSLQQIDEHLIYWSPFIIHKCKQRLTKLRQMIIQKRKLKLQGKQELVPIKKKAQKRDRIRQAKALYSANIEQKIEQQLMQRLKTGVYKDIYSYNPKVFNKLVGRDQQQQEMDEEELQDKFVAEIDSQFEQEEIAEVNEEEEYDF